ncbi:hypothetical protein NDA13_004752 [Ustilago tritici]|nr:hypothetical protein NDA13_004752 [Ustilago tritici]
MLRPLLSHLGTQTRDTLRPTLFAVIWCVFLLILKRNTLTVSTWPTRARFSLDASYHHTTEAETQTLDWDKVWKDVDWASYRVMASLSTVTGLLLAFRSNSAIDRWSTARRKWSDVQATSRSLLRLLAPTLLSQPLSRGTETMKDFVHHQSKQKETQATLATIPFFSISLMYEMRGRSMELFPTESPSLLRDDLIESLPPALVAAAHRQQQPSSASSSPLRSAETEKQKQIANLNSPRTIRPPLPSHATSGNSSPNLALSSLLHLQQSLDAFHPTSLLTSPVYAHSIGLVNSLTSHMTELERVRDTPIPLSVSQHFSRLLAIQTSLLAVVVVQKLYERWWLCLGITGVVTGMLYGVDSFAAALGQPFGLEREDLPLEKYVQDAQRDWDEARGLL